MRPLSLRNRLILGAVSLVALGLLIADLAGILLFKSFQLNQVDDQLRAPFGSSPPKQFEDQLARVCTDSRSADLPQLPTSFRHRMSPCHSRLKVPRALFTSCRA